MHIRRIASHYILSPRGLIRNGILTLDGEGTVLDCSAAQDIDSIEGVEFHSGILIPGMVNAHTHLELSYLKGQIAEGGGFTAFAKGIARTRESFSTAERIEAASYQDARMQAEGVVAASDICNSDITFGLKKHSGIYYHSFLELFGLGLKDASSIMPLKQEADAAGIPATITPHATYSLNDGAFRAAVGAASNSPLSIHFMESSGDYNLFRERGEFRQWYDRERMRTDFTNLYESPADRIIKCVPADRKILLIHNVCIREEDVIALQSHFGSNLTWVLCPCSNRYITAAEPPVELLRKHGGRIAVGTDSLASNRSLSMAEELKALGGKAPLEELLRWATLNGAEALGIDGIYGSFDKGKRPGAALLSGIEWETMTLTTAAAIKKLA